MILEIINDMKNFLIVFFIGVIGFSCGFYILGKMRLDEAKNFYSGGKDDESPNIFKSFISTYRVSQGDFQFDKFYNFTHDWEIIMVWGLFVFCTLFCVIVLLNILISIMGDTFSRTMENLTNLSIMERVMLVAENEVLFDR